MANLPVGTTIYEWTGNGMTPPSVYTTTTGPRTGDKYYDIYGNELGSIFQVEMSGNFISIFSNNYENVWDRSTSDTSSTTVQEETKYFSKLSNGTNTYVIKDANAVHTSDVTSTYSPTGTAPVNGTAVASALPTVNNSTITITQGGVTKGSFTLNQASGDTIALDAGGGSSYTAGTNINISSNTISTTAAKVTIRRYS